MSMKSGCSSEPDAAHPGVLIDAAQIRKIEQRGAIVADENVVYDVLFGAISSVCSQSGKTCGRVFLEERNLLSMPLG